MQTRLTSIEATQSLLDEKKIPALDENQYQLLADYLFSANLPLRLQVAETVFRHDRQHPRALGLFLACTFPSAQAIAGRLSNKILLHPTDLKTDLMYGGAVNALSKLFRSGRLAAENQFHILLSRTMKDGAIQAVFARTENTQFLSLGTRDAHPPPPRLEEQLFAKQMLEKIVALDNPDSPTLIKFLRCIILQIGPHNALRIHGYKTHKKYRPLIIDFEPVMKELGISRSTAAHYLSRARKMLIQMFNQDGTLFITKNQPPSKRR